MPHGTYLDFGKVVAIIIIRELNTDLPIAKRSFSISVTR